MTEVAPGILLVLAPNPGPMTLEGTDTWILGPRSPGVTAGPQHRRLPGPSDEGPPASGPPGRPVRPPYVVLTHRHLDHSEGLVRFAELTGSGVRATDPAYAIPTGRCDGRLDDGLELGVGDLAIRVVATPGHTSDSTSLLVIGPSGRWLLTGDMVLGRGTTVITHPDGDVGAYLNFAGRAAHPRPRARRDRHPPGPRAGRHRPGGGADLLPRASAAAPGPGPRSPAAGRHDRGGGGGPRVRRCSTAPSGRPPNSPSGPSWTTSVILQRLPPAMWSARPHSKATPRVLQHQRSRHGSGLPQLRG